MLDVSLILQEAETLLDEHYSTWQQQGSGRVRVYPMPQKRQVPVAVTKTPEPRSPIVNDQAQKGAISPASQPKATGISEVVANVVVFLLLNVLSDRLSRKGTAK